jgi:hypothetical protein
MSKKKFFWLHIKKSGGITTRKLLQPYYVEVDRVKRPKCFIQASPQEYNDILNNYRILLGDYQLKRCLFAKKFLFPDSYNDMVSFAFVREPIDRCLSMFFYLYSNQRNWIYILKQTTRQLIQKRTLYNTSYAFDNFLELIQESRNSPSSFYPKGLHFVTHTNSMWEDVSDFEGNILLKKIFRLEDLIWGINQVFEECDIDKKLQSSTLRLNVNKYYRRYLPNHDQRRKIGKLFEKDFGIYESANLVV